MTRISRPGRTEGYALLDAVLALLVAAAAAAAILGAAATATRLARDGLRRAELEVAGRNEAAACLLRAP